MTFPARSTTAQCMSFAFLIHPIIAPPSIPTACWNQPSQKRGRRSPLSTRHGHSSAAHFFSSDAYLNATIDELRIYDGRLTPQEIAAHFKFGPDALALAVAVTASNAPAGLNLFWPAYAVGFALETSPAVDSPTSWTTVKVSPALNNDLWQLTMPATNFPQFYRLRR